MKHILFYLFITATSTVWGQTQVDLRTQSKQVDFTGAVATKPFKAGTVLPASCGTGELFFDTAATAGSNVYACTATNTWTLEEGNGNAFTVGSGAPATGCTTGQVYYDTTNSVTWLCESPGTWAEVLTTTGSGPFQLTGQNGSNPSTPSAGSTVFFFNSTAKTGQSVDDGGALATMVRPTDCSAAGGLAQKVNSDGTVSCAGSAVVEFNFPAGSGSSSSPQSGAWWQDGSVPAVCPGGSPYQCYLHWNSGSSQIAVTVKIPHLWSGGTVSVLLAYQGNGSGNTVQPAVASGCAGNGSSGITFNAAQNFPSQATSGNAYYISTLSGLTTTGCTADSVMVLLFSRADAAGYMNVTSASIMFNVP